MKDQKDYITQVAAQMKDWDAEIQRLETEVETATSEEAKEVQQQIEELRTKKQEAQQELKERLKTDEDEEE